MFAAGRDPWRRVLEPSGPVAAATAGASWGMTALQRMVRTFFRGVEGWGRSRDREGIVDARSTGPCPRCGEERIRVRDFRVDDLGYSVRLHDRWSCGCDGGPDELARRRDPAGAV